MPNRLRGQLQNQKRFYGTCIFYDLDNDKCGIYSARPETCRNFGYYKQLVCFRNPKLATKDLDHSKEEFVGTLSIDFNWQHFS